MSLIYKVVLERLTVDLATPQWSELYPEKFDKMCGELYDLGLLYFTFETVSANILHNIIHFPSAESFQQFEIAKVSVPEYIERTEYDSQHNISRRIISQGYIDL